MKLSHGSARTSFVLTIVALAAVSTFAISAASFTDEALTNLGTGAEGAGLGNPNTFDIAVLDANGVAQDAEQSADAVVLPLSSGSAFSESEPVVFEPVFLNRDPGVTGDLTFGVFDPDDSGSGDLFHSLRFTVFLDGNSTPVIEGATAVELNEAGSVVENVSPGTYVEVRLEVTIASGTGGSAAGKSTMLGVVANGESR